MSTISTFEPRERSAPTSSGAMRMTATAIAVLGAMAALSGCGGDGGSGETVNTKPSYLGTITSTSYDGNSNDLLTAGLGKTGIGSATAPTVADPANPTAAELRRLAIYNNYRALVDVSTAGGFGSLFGPNVDINGVATSNEGKIAGSEHIAYSDDGSGAQNVTMMVQVPDSFNPNSPCIVAAPSSGSRGVYGAIGTAGEWGLKHGCAVAYTDKGTGNGVHDLQSNTVSLQNGVRADAATAGKNSNFTAALTASERTAFNAAFPNRVAVKHAHSQQNSEKDWGKYTLQAVEFAYYVLNEKYGATTGDGSSHVVRFTPSNTITIASSVSNGGGASIAALEQDTKGLISGVAVAEPEVQLAPDNRLNVVRGSTVMNGTGKTLYDYFTIANLLQPCAALQNTATNAFNTINTTIAANRCIALRNAGLISGATTAEMASSAMTALRTAGWQPESDVFQASHYSFAVPAVTVSYANAYGRFSVKDNVCGYSFATTSATTFAPIPTPAAVLATTFGTGNGVPPMAGINIVNNNSLGGPLLDAASLSVDPLGLSQTGVQDYNAPGAFCLRELAVGNSANAQRVQQGIRETLRSANLRGKPAVIVHGRSDTLLPTSLTSRPYFGMNKITEGNSSKLSYIEVTNAQHFESFLTFPGFAERLVPLHRYFIQAMDMMYANLKNGAPLPESQVVRTTPRGLNGTTANPITATNVPPIKTTAAAGDRITFSNNTVNIPD